MAPKERTKPTFKPTDDERKRVGQMTAVGISQESICLLIRNGIDSKTLRKHFRFELDTAIAKANASIGGALFNKAIGGDTAALIFWAKTRMRWRETNDLEVTVRNAVLVAPAGMTPDQWILGQEKTNAERDSTR